MDLEALIIQVARRTGIGNPENPADLNHKKLAEFIRNAIKIVLEKVKLDIPQKILIDEAAFRIANTAKPGIYAEVEIVPKMGGERVMAMTFGGGQYGGKPDDYDRKTGGTDASLVQRKLFYVKDIKKGRKNVWVAIGHAVKNAKSSDFRLDIQL